MKAIKLIIVTAVVSVLGCCSAEGQQVFNEDDNLISLGFGYSLLNASVLFEIYEEEDGFLVNTFGPLNLQFEHAMDENIGFGIDLGYSTVEVGWIGTISEYNEATGVSEDVNYDYDYTRSKLTVNLRGNYHLSTDDMIDPYVGFGMGFKVTQWDLESADDEFVGINIGGFSPVSLVLRVGARIMFSENIGAYIEGGAGHGIFQGGLTVKI